MCYLLYVCLCSRSIDRQCKAFVNGLHDVIPQTWLLPFSAPELQILVSGSNAGVDIDDLRTNCVYTGGYHALHPTVRNFWSVLESLNSTDRSALLKFVTSCERAPSLGFRNLDPPFCIQYLANDQALPVASTCFHTLKLPSYSNSKVMKEKLLTASHSGAGFELT
jgi:ubiquitin-protein ligase E3 C